MVGQSTVDGKTKVCIFQHYSSATVSDRVPCAGGNGRQHDSVRESRIEFGIYAVFHMFFVHLVFLEHVSFDLQRGKSGKSRFESRKQYGRDSIGDQ